MIETSYGANFEETDLVNYVRNSGRNYIIQGQSAFSKKDHPKPSSLDYWLRQFWKNPNTKQADNKVIKKLVLTGLFKESENKLICQDSGHMCKALVLVE